MSLLCRYRSTLLLFFLDNFVTTRRVGDLRKVTCFLKVLWERCVIWPNLPEVILKVPALDSVRSAAGEERVAGGSAYSILRIRV